MKEAFDVTEFIRELGAGVYEQKLQRAISETAGAVMQYERAGEIVLTFKLTPIGSHQVKIQHKIGTKAPTMNGEKSEKNVTDTVMYVGTKGQISIFPENQMPLFEKKGTTTTQ